MPLDEMLYVGVYTQFSEDKPVVSKRTDHISFIVIE